MNMLGDAMNVDPPGSIRLTDGQRVGLPLLRLIKPRPHVPPILALKGRVQTRRVAADAAVVEQIGCTTRP